MLEKLKKLDWKHECRIMAGEAAGSFFVAIGTVNFAANLNVPMTGVTGVAMILYWLYKLPIGWMTLLFNIPLAILCIRVLGGFDARYGETSVAALSTGRLQALVTYLLLHGDTSQPRQHLAFQFWPDAPHHPGFPSILLKAGETRVQETRWRFGT